MPHDPIGGVVRNLFTLQRIGNALSADAAALLQALFADIIAQLARIDPSSPNADRHRRQRVEKLMGEIEDLTGDAYADLVKTMRKELARLTLQQSAWAAAQIGKSVLGFDLKPGRISPDMARAIVDTDPIRGRTLEQWFESQKLGTIERVRQEVQLGMVQNETIDEIVRRIRGRRVGNKNVGGVMRTSTSQAEAIARTAVNHIANVAHFTTYQKNADITEEYEIVATLDARTTIICASLDGQRFRYDDPRARKPPFHIRCRTVIVPVISWAKLGLKPPPEGTRASAGGQVPSSMKYQDWLKQQSVGQQNEILGPGRAELFRQGKITLRDLVIGDQKIVRLSDLQAERRAARRPLWQNELGKTVASQEDALSFRKQLQRRFRKNSEFNAFVQGVDEWQFYATQPNIRAAIEDVVLGRGADPRAIAMLRALERSDPAPELFRGWSTARALPHVAGEYRAGYEFDLPLSSFTSARRMATRYAGLGADQGRPTEVVFRLAQGARAVKIENIAYRWFEREWYSGGRFRVVRTRRLNANRLEITLEQIGIFSVR